MLKLKERFMTDNNGRRIGVFIGISSYRRIIRNLEELESIRAFDEAKLSKDKPIPIKQAIKEIERGR
ncbi:MAG: hypothetical protein HZA48_03290 [Planctomycetes bacterium]|nr:hypothetical protein [Planctomycetota bacterium]